MVLKVHFLFSFYFMFAVVILASSLNESMLKKKSTKQTYHMISYEDWCFVRKTLLIAKSDKPDFINPHPLGAAPR